MIGKKLSERYSLGALPPARAVELLRELLSTHARPVVEVRARDPGMIACVFAHADKQTLRLCREIGLEMTPGGTGVVGLTGEDVARLVPSLDARQRDWLRAPCAARETKVLLVAGGLALLSIETDRGDVAIQAFV